MKRSIAIILIACTLLALAGCRAYPIEHKGATLVYIYYKPLSEEKAFSSVDSFGLWKAGTISSSDGKKLRSFINSIRDWQDDNLANREPFVFSGFIQVLKNADPIYYFTEDGFIYHDHYFGKLPDKGIELLNEITASSKK